jgi:hypothetical protein
MNLRDKRLYPLYAFIVTLLIIVPGFLGIDNAHFFVALIAALLISALTYLYTTE